jgi:hypothetical protein
MYLLLISLAFLAFIGYHTCLVEHQKSLLREHRARLLAILEVVETHGLTDDDRLIAIHTLVTADINKILQNKNENFFGNETVNWQKSKHKEQR